MWPKKVKPSKPFRIQKEFTTAGISTTLLGRTARHIIGTTRNIIHIMGAKLLFFLVRTKKSSKFATNKKMNHGRDKAY
jgi:hypothetical protein